jgi:uncharacterized protein (TIGR03663 family)
MSVTTLSPESTGSSKPSSLLERPAFGLLRINWETLAWILLFVVGGLARFIMLDARAMSHDESLHTLYSYYLYANGNYDHNPMMHGPFRYHFTALIYFLFGDNDFTSRMGPALFGLGLMGVVCAYRRWIGRAGALVAGVLVALSPTLLYHSRYIRDDIFMAFFTALWIYAAFRYLERPAFKWASLMVTAMAVGFATMENHFIHGAIIGAFFAGLAIYQVIGWWLWTMVAPLILGATGWFWFHEQKNDPVAFLVLGIAFLIAVVPLLLGGRGRWREFQRRSGGDLAVIMLTMVLPFTASFLFMFTGGDVKIFENIVNYANPADQVIIIRLAVLVGVTLLLSLGIAWLWFARRQPDGPDGAFRLHFRHWALLMGFFWFVQVLFYTTFFTNTVQGLATGTVGSLGYWLAQQGVKRGNQPVYYYALIGWLYEFLPAILSVGGIVAVVRGALGLNMGVRWQPTPLADLPGDVALPSAAPVEAGTPSPDSGEVPDLPQTRSKDDPAYHAKDLADHLRLTRIEFVVFTVVWTLGAWIGYTFAGEKMPWLLTHIALPMCVLGGWWFATVLGAIPWREVWRNRTLALTAAPAIVLVLIWTLLNITLGGGRETGGPAQIVQWLLVLGMAGLFFYFAAIWWFTAGARTGLRLVGVGIVALLWIFTVRASFMLNFINFDMATEYLVYAHGGPDIKPALAEIDMLSERTVGGRNIEVAYDDQSAWPMSWYMRQYPNARFYGSNPTQETMSAPVIIVGPENRAKVEPYVARDYTKRTYRLVWWPDMDYFDLTWDRIWGALNDPLQRDRLFNIIVYRKHRDKADLTQWQNVAKWPYQHEFDLYVRRDLAALIWDQAVTPVETESTVPQLSLDKKVPLEAMFTFTGPYDGLPLLNPRAVAVGPGGETVIADTGNHRIVLLDGNGGVIKAVGSYCGMADPANQQCIDPDGAGPLEMGDGQFFEPWGVAMAPDGTIFVADTWNGRIQVFDSQGNFLRKWGRFDTTNGELGDPFAIFGPRGLAVDLAGSLLVADTGNKRILAFTPEGALLRQQGGGGVVGGRFEEPTDVKVDPTDGTVLVADAWNQRIQRLSPTLEFLSEYPVPGWTGREVYQKPSLAVTTDGSLYAGDPALNLVFKFDRTGQLTALFGGSGTDNGSFGMPNGLVVDGVAGELLVADGGNNRVMVFPLLP